MGRAIRRTGWFLGMQLLLMAAAFAEEAPTAEYHYPPVSVDMTVHQVSEHAYSVEGTPGVPSAGNQGFVSNSGFVVTGAGVVVFDALGSPSLAGRLLEKIRSVTDEPVVRVIVSHYQPDHIYGLQVFSDLDAEILAPDGAGEYLESDRARQRLDALRVSLAPWVNEHTRLVAPDRYLGEGTRFRLGDVEFVITLLGAAHSDGDLALYIAPDRVMFCGDLVFDGMVPFLGDADTRRWLEVLARMDRERLAALVPGHGPMAGDPHAAIAFTRGYLEYLRKTMGKAVRARRPFDKAYEQVDWSDYAHLPVFSEANRRNARRVYHSLEAEPPGERASPGP